MTNEHIALDRAFSSLDQYDEPNVVDESSFDWESVWESPINNGVGWQELIQKDKVIILAEAGTGKTEELKAISKQLYDRGEPAFFLRLELLLESDFQIGDNLNADETRCFQEWAGSGDDEFIAYFFLDSVDEAKLQKSNALELILSRFVTRIGSENLSRTKVFMTSRFSEWRVESDLRTFKERLIPPEIVSSSDQASQREIKVPPKIVYRLNPLSDEQIKKFAQQTGLPDPEQFINEIQQADAISFAQRPQDLIDLIAYWQDNNQQLPENYIKLIQFNINRKLSEFDDSRALQFPLSPEDARFGSQLLAAATILCKRNSIRLPETEKDNEIRQVSIDASSVMPRDWEVSKQRALMMRPIFDPEIYGAIRFHHRSVREFLTAQWLYQILDSTPIARQAVSKLLFVEKYGHNVVIPSMQPIAAWLSCWDKGTRNKLVKKAPEVLVEYGDPSVFTVKFRIKLLNTLIEQYQQKKRTDIQIEPSVLKRLASDDTKMVAVISSKLKQHSKNEDLCKLLLETVRQGKLVACSPVLEGLATDKKNSEIVRVIASRSLLELGDVSSQRQMIETLFKQGANGRKIISWDCDYLFPEIITPTQLVEIISDSPQQGRRPSHDLKYQLDKLAAAATRWDKTVTAQLIRGMYGLIKQEPLIENVRDSVSPSYVWLLEHAVQFTNPLIENQDTFCFDPVVLDLFWLFSKLQNGGTLHTHVRDLDILDPAKNWHEFAYRLFWYAVEASRSRNIPPLNWKIVFGYSFVIWQPQLSDWNRLIRELSVRDSQLEKRIALTALYTIFVDSDSSDEKLNEMRNSIDESSDLWQELENWLSPSAISISDEYDSSQDEWILHQNEREAQHRNDVETVRADSDSFRDLYIPENGFLNPAAEYLYSSLRNLHPNGSMQKSFSQWELLEPEFGSAVAEAFRDGCIKLWRDFDPMTLEGWREENYLILCYGLTGLAMESVHVTDWISCLSPGQATRAAIYATREMNNFPDWLSELQQAFPEEIKAVFLEEIRYELFESNSSYSTILALLCSNSKGFDSKIFIPDLIELLESTEKIHNPDAAKRALNIVIENEPPSEAKEEIQRRLASVGMRFHQATETNQEKLFWLHVLFAVDADKALKLLNESVTHFNGNSQQKQEWINSIFAQFSHEGRHRIYSNYFQDYTRIEVLEKLVPLVRKLINEQDDIVRENGPYTPTDRDDAQHIRFQLLDMVAKTPGQQAHDLLVNWAGEPLFVTAQDWLLNQAKRRAEEDSEFRAWKEEEILEFTEKYHGYRSNTVHKLWKSIVDNPRTSTIAGVIGAIAAVVALFGSTDTIPQSNTNVFHGDATNVTIQQNTDSPSVIDIEGTSKDFDQEPQSADELKKRLQTYEEIIESDPENIEAYNDIGLIQMSVDNAYAAVEAFGKMLSIAEKEGAQNWQGIAYANLGLANQKRNNLEIACVNWQKSLTLLDSTQSADKIQTVQKSLRDNCQK